MTKLYEIATQMRDLQNNEELDPQSVVDTLEGMEMELQDKAINLIAMTQNIKGDIDAVDAEIKRLQARKKAMQNRVDNFHSYLRDNMERSGITKIS